MDLKELCKEVDRIAVLERREPDMTTTDKRKPVKKRSRSGNTTRYVFQSFFLNRFIVIIYYTQSENVL